MNDQLPPSHEVSRPAAAAGDAAPRPRQGRWWILIVVLGIAAIAAAIWYASGRSVSAVPEGPRAGAPGKAGGKGGDPATRVTPVVAAPVKQGTLDIYLYALGTVTPLNSVTVRSRVDGQLMKVAFEEGQMVKKGDLLAQIDPRPFEVQLTLANGNQARNKALLENAKVDVQRYRTLLAQDSISKQQVDTQESLVRQYEAAVQADQGNIDNAKLQLTYTRIVAPISGRVGLRQVDPGNIVRAADPNGIVVITQLSPIGVVFPIPEYQLPRGM
jgi:multidrug efflux system membrane fusion protein